MRSLYDAFESDDDCTRKKTPFESVHPHELFPTPGEFATLDSLDDVALDETPEDSAPRVFPLRLGRDAPLPPAY